MNKYILVLAFTAFFFNGQLADAQQDIPIYEWRAYIPYNESYAVAQSDNYVYSAAERGILKIDKSDLSLEKISKVDGLSDTEPRNLVFDPTTKSLVVAYINGNIDIMTADGIVNMPNIFNNSTIVELKSPNHSRIDDASHAYIAYDFGLVQLNLSSFTFGFSLRTSFPVNDFVQFQGRFFISTDEGIYWADENPNLNHADLSVWNKLIAGFPSSYGSQSITHVKDKLFAGVNGDLAEITTFLPVIIRAAPPNYGIRTLSGFDESFAASFEFFNPGVGFRIDEFFIYNESGQLQASYTSASCSIIVRDMIQDEQGRLFYANEQNLKYIEEVGLGCGVLTPPGPPNTDAFEVAFRNQEIIVASGELALDGAAVFNRNGIFNYNQGDWSQFNHENGFFGDSVISYTDVSVSSNGTLAIGTFFEGVLTVNSEWELVNHYTFNNSCIEDQNLLAVASIGDVQYDANDNLWISNYRASTPLKMIDRDGECHEFPISRSFQTKDLREIAIDERGVKWISTFDQQVGIIVFDEGELDDISDDQFRILNSNNTALTDNLVWDIKADLDGDIWVGTDQGVVVFDCAASIFNAGCFGRQPIVEVDGVAALLLQNERVLAVEIDGANRKWFGTANGIFVQSTNGEEEVLRFTTQNSPLLSDLILDIAINPLTGEAIISTDRGIMSYRTDATNGGSIHLPESEVFAFPNPVRPNHNGPIAIKGLPRDARVKITDIQGKLMFDGSANGGEAIWDGRDYTGRKAASGVYLVFSTSQSAFEKPDAIVAKILIVN